MGDSKTRRYIRELREGNLVVAARDSESGSAGRALYSLRDVRVATLADVLRSLIAMRAPEEAEALFRALADASRLALLDLVQYAPCGPSEAGEALGLEQSNTAKHFEVLRDARLVTRTERSKKHVDYSLADERIFQLFFLPRFFSRLRIDSDLSFPVRTKRV